jgi:beta-N-acetylhexosaminidase
MSAPSLGQLLLVGVPGPELDPAFARMARELQLGGFILFGRNIQTPEQLRKLIDDLRDLSAVEPIITIDQEGGRVSRLRLLGHEPPSAQQLREKNDPALILRHGELTGQLLRLFGFNLDLCPVLDISLDDEADNSLRGRCYGRTAEEVVEKAGLFNSALRATGVLSCGKHFPGYTRAGLDPHHDLPALPLTRNEWEALESIPFRSLLPEVDSVMMGHISLAGLDDGPWPASLSARVIQELLRGELGFSGLVMTDDLDMGAVLNHFGFEETMIQAIMAGNDLLMLCHRVELAPKVVEAAAKAPRAEIDRALAAVARLREKFAPPTEFSLARHAALDAAVWDLRVATLGEEKARERSPEDGKRSPVELY